MNAFYEHHQNNIAFGYRCFDRLLLNGLIQPFQQPERVTGFFNTYRQLYPVSRDVLRDIAGQFHNWVINRSRKWSAPILESPPDRRDKFMDPYFRRAKPNQVVAIIKGREPARLDARRRQFFPSLPVAESTENRVPASYDCINATGIFECVNARPEFIESRRKWDRASRQQRIRRPSNLARLARPSGLTFASTGG